MGFFRDRRPSLYRLTNGGIHHVYAGAKAFAA